MSVLVKQYQSAEIVTELPEFEGDTRHLWRHTEHNHHTDTESRDSS